MAVAFRHEASARRQVTNVAMLRGRVIAALMNRSPWAVIGHTIAPRCPRDQNFLVIMSNNACGSSPAFCSLWMNLTGKS